MKLMPGVIVVGIVLAIALLLCVVVESPIMVVITAIACIFYALAVLGIITYASLEFWRESRDLRETLREIKYMLKL